MVEWLFNNPQVVIIDSLQMFPWPTMFLLSNMNSLGRKVRTFQSKESVPLQRVRTFQSKETVPLQRVRTFQSKESVPLQRVRTFQSKESVPLQCFC